MTHDADDREARLAALLEEALAAHEAGTPPDLDAMCAHEPDLRGEIEQMLALGSGLRAMHLARDTVDSMSGRVLHGRYEVLGFLGKGAAGSVYRARDRELSRDVAVKVLTESACVGSTAAERFLRESEILAQHEHPHVVRIHDRGRTDDGRPYLVTELLRGVSLSTILDAARDAMPDGPDPRHYASSDWLATLLPDARLESSFLRQVVRWIAELAEGLALAHARGVFHRDVKPSNAFVRDDGSAVLLDFGIAVRTGDPALTLDTAVLGTPWYMAPEQARGRTEPNAALDVYGASATLYHLLTLRAPHGSPGEQAGIAEALAAARDRDPITAATLHRGLPRDLAAILDVGLDPDPRRRYASAAALVADLAAFLEHRPVRARPLGPIGRAVRHVRRRPARTLAIGGAIATVALGALILPLAHRVHAADSELERTGLLSHLPADLCIEGWPDQRLAIPLDERSRVVEQLDRLLELAPDDLATRLLRAAERLDAGDRPGAAADLHAIAAMGSSEYLRSVAACYTGADSSRAGIEAVRLADLPEPRTPTDCFVAGFHALRARQVASALELLNRATEFVPARDLRLLALLANARWDDALADAHWLEGHFGHPTARTRHTLAAAALGLRHFEDARRFALDAIELRPDRHGPWNNLAYAQLRLGQLDNAEASFRSAIRIRPWFDNSRAGLCQVLRSKEQFAEAREEARRIDANWWREWELANVDLAESLCALRGGDEPHAVVLADSAAAGFARSAEDPDPTNQKRKSAAGSITFARAVAGGDRKVGLGELLRTMRAEPLGATQVLNLCTMLGDAAGAPVAVDGAVVDALRLWLCEVGLEFAPDDPRMHALRDRVRESVRTRNR